MRPKKFSDYDGMTEGTYIVKVLKNDYGEDYYNSSSKVIYLDYVQPFTYFTAEEMEAKRKEEYMKNFDKDVQETFGDALYNL